MKPFPATLAGLIALPCVLWGTLAGALLTGLVVGSLEAGIAVARVLRSRLEAR